ncbi:hypothetical protein [Microbispora sp. CA-102843]|uniref:hypothetical protein n=1 Tax=Microbispora sp. CA-102843 TaxID=3239952 RepID=UPI003D8F93CD
MPIIHVKVRHKDSGATAEINPAALRYFPDYELAEPPAPDPAQAPTAPAGPPSAPARQPTAPRPRRAADADKE